MDRDGVVIGLWFSKKLTVNAYEITSLGGYDSVIIKVDALGQVQWAVPIGSPDEDSIPLVATGDGLVLAAMRVGTSASVGSAKVDGPTTVITQLDGQTGNVNWVHSVPYFVNAIARGATRNWTVISRKDWRSVQLESYDEWGRVGWRRVLASNASLRGIGISARNDSVVMLGWADSGRIMGLGTTKRGYFIASLAEADGRVKKVAWITQAGLELSRIGWVDDTVVVAGVLTAKVAINSQVLKPRGPRDVILLGVQLNQENRIAWTRQIGSREADFLTGFSAGEKSVFLSGIAESYLDLDVQTVQNANRPSWFVTEVSANGRIAWGIGRETHFASRGVGVVASSAHIFLAGGLAARTELGGISLIPTRGGCSDYFLARLTRDGSGQ